MSNITEAHAEWAVVDRWRQMLEASCSLDYSVTESFAHFSSIILWVLQRVRDKQRVMKGNDGSNLLSKWEKENFVDQPWWKKIEPQQTIKAKKLWKLDATKSSSFDEKTVLCGLKSIRDAIAHGDDQRVKPYNEGSRLIGFSFHLYNDKCLRKATWNESLLLTQSDMQILGAYIANQFCQYFTPADHPEFSRVASTIKERAA